MIATAAAIPLISMAIAYGVIGASELHNKNETAWYIQYFDPFNQKLRWARKYVRRRVQRQNFSSDEDYQRAFDARVSKIMETVSYEILKNLEG